MNKTDDIAIPCLTPQHEFKLWLWNEKWKGRNKHPYLRMDNLIKTQSFTVAIYCGREKKGPPRLQPIWWLNRAVTNSSDNSVSGANIAPKCLKLNGDPLGPAWQIVSDWQSVCLPTNFEMSSKVESELTHNGKNTVFSYALLLYYSK